eukprot:378525_1
MASATSSTSSAPTSSARTVASPMSGSAVAEDTAAAEEDKIIAQLLWAAELPGRLRRTTASPMRVHSAVEVDTATEFRQASATSSATTAPVSSGRIAASPMTVPAAADAA